MTLRISRLALGITVAALSSACALATEENEQVDSASNAIKAPAAPDISRAKEDREARRAQREAERAEKKAERAVASAKAKAARAAKRALREAERAAMLREGFESYDAGSAPDDFSWFGMGKSYYTVTDQESARGKKSLELVSVIDPAYPDNRIGAKVCSSVGSTTALTVDFKLRINGANPNGYSFVGISNNPELAAYWWIFPDGTITNFVDDFGKLQANTWNDIQIVVDLADDLATFTLNGVSVSSDISTVWGLIARPIECLRLASSSQNMLVDQVTIQPEILSL
jgi:hypothetical protein